MENLNQLFTWQSLASFQGAATVALIVPNVLGFLIGNKFSPFKKWFAFVIAIVLSLAVAYLAESTDITKWIVAIVNGFLIFASAVGINQSATASLIPNHDMALGEKKQPSLIRLVWFNSRPLQSTTSQEKHFFSSWF